MLVYSGDKLNIKYNDWLDPAWRCRDFVSEVNSYALGTTEKVLGILGLRGTGKTVGVLQAIKDMDAIYITAQENEDETAEDYLRVLKQTENKIIVIDEYSWIKNHEIIDGYLYTLVQNGHRVIITGTEGIGIARLSYGRLIHRINFIHTNYFSFSEYLRVFDCPVSYDSVNRYLREGGLFSDYIIRSMVDLDSYYREAVFGSLSKHIHGISEECCRAIVYKILYTAICETMTRNDNEQSIPLDTSRITLDEFYRMLNIDADQHYNQTEFNEVASVLESIDIILRIRNLYNEDEYETVIVNPAVSYQLIKTIYRLDVVPGTFVGHIYEAMCICEKYHTLAQGQGIYYYSSRENGINRQMDIIVLDEFHRNDGCHVFECKHGSNYRVKGTESFMSDVLEKIFPDGQVIRYIMYNGQPNKIMCDDKEVIYISPDMHGIDYKDVESMRNYVDAYKKRTQEYIHKKQSR